MARGSVFMRCAHGVTGVAGKPKCPPCSRARKGSWSWRANIETDPLTGKRSQPSQGGYPTKVDAEEALTEYYSAQQAGTWATDKHLTVTDWLREWLASLALEPKTLTGYTGHVENVLIPHLGHHRLRDLRRHHVETMIRELAAPNSPARPQVRRPKVKCADTKKNGDPCTNWAVYGGTHCGVHGGKPARPNPGRGGRAVESRQPRTLDSYRRTLRAALAAAVRRDLISRNVTEGRIDALPPIRRADVGWWQPDQVARFLLAVQADRMAACYELAAFAGLRRAELLGLRWEDVDLTSDTPGLLIRQTLSGLAGSHPCHACGGTHVGRRLKPPKTDAGARWVPLVGGTVTETAPDGTVKEVSAGTVRELLAHRAAQELERDAWGEAYTDHGLVFAEEDGTPFRPDTLTKAFEKHCKAAGLPKIRLHDQRHGAASLLLAAGVPIELVAMILGHASPQTTRAVYAHILKAPASEGMRAAAELVRPTE